jgi:hypothetical protein
MLKVVVGHSNDPDSEAAIAEVLEQCWQDLEGEIPRAGLLLAAIDFDHALILEAIQERFPGIELIGCTTDGEVSSRLSFQEDSLVLTLFCSDTIAIQAGLGRNLSQDPVAAAEAAVAQAGSAATAKLCLTVPDGFSISGVTAVDSLKQALGNHVPISGGTAGDQWRFEKTYQFFGSEVVSDAMPILLFSGDLLVSCGVASGWQPISRMGIVTRAEGAIVHEIDHQPATDFYQFYLENLFLTGEYPLAVYESEADGFYLRSPLSKQYEPGGSISFMGDVPQGTKVQITHATGDDLIAATQTSIEKALFYYPGKQPAAALLFSCAARRWLLGPRTWEEYQLCQQSLDPGLPVSGFYTYGEIGQLRPGGETYYHQETFVTLLFGVE